MTTEYLRPSGHWKKPKKSFFSSPLKRKIFKGFVVACALGIVFSTAALAWVSRDLPNPNTLIEQEVEQSTQIYDRTGTHLLYEIHGNKNRTLVKLEQIPLTVQRAFIAVEDQQFYSHKGFNPIRLVKGVIVGALFKGRAQGGSTITQQLVSNAILTKERTVTRKLKEIILSIALERSYTKDQILQLYLNEIPFGSTNYGIESASQAYFGKSVKDVTLAEAATLASLPKAPTTYLNNPDKLDARRDTVLKLMFDEGYITEEEKNAAQAEEVKLKEVVDRGIIAPHFVFYIKEQLVEAYGERMVEQGGLRVITTLDYDKQLAAEAAVTEGVEARGDRYGFNNAGLVALDPKTGQVLSMVGSKDYFDETIDGAVNVTVRPLQPGSSFKPLVYTYGFMKGYTPNSILWDVITPFKTGSGDYTPHNYHFEMESGPVTIRKALQGSLNIPAVKMLALLDVPNVLDFADKLGYTTFTDRSRFGLAIVLGGGEVLPIEHTSAYATIANDGLRHAIASVLKVTSPSGEVLQEWKEDSGEQVIDQNVARMTSNVLSDNSARAYVFGASNYLTLPGRAAAAKTGTTNDYNDAWTLGYTPSLAAGVWVGNTDGSEMVRGADGSQVAAPIWQAYMKKALEGTPAESFTAPQIPTTGKAIIDGALPSTTITIDKDSGKLATDETPESSRQTMTCGEYHSELYYIDPANPLGDPPGDQPTNAQFVAWETAVQGWVTRMTELHPGDLPFESCVIPTESDDVHTRDNQPSVRITSPTKNDTIDSRSFTVELRSSARRGVERVEYAIDGKFIQSSRSGDRAEITLPSWVKAGKHTLTATAYDDVDNHASDDVSIQITAAAPSATIEIIDPLNSQIIETAAGVYSVVVQLTNPSDIRSVSLYATHRDGTGLMTIGEQTHPTSPYVTFNWSLATSGDYLLFARATDADKNNLESSQALVTVILADTSVLPDLDITKKEESDTDAVAPTTTP